jgi:hypothetical protein
VIHGPNGGEPTKWDRISTANDGKKRNNVVFYPTI